MASKDSFGKTIVVAFVLCLVCSVVVSVSAVMLKDMQKANKELDFQRNLLSAANLLEEGKSVEELFQSITPRIVDLSTGKFADDAQNVETYDQRKAAKDPQLSTPLEKAEDIAKLSRLEKYAVVYTAERDGKLDKIILPIRGYGLWSTLYGFIALEADLNTIVGLGYYEHGETAGLGGEVDNPRWKALWEDKEVYDNSGDVAISVIKGSVDSADPNADNKVDGLSGATLTSKGVSNMVQFWLGDDGYGKFLANLKANEA